MFEIYTIVSEIYSNADVVLGVKNFVELEGEISMRDQTFKFLDRAVPFFHIHKEMIKCKGRRYVKVEAPFLDQISGLGIINILALDT